MSKFLYFSYGSNILEQRLVDRCPSAKPAGLAIAKDRTVEFSKSSKDGSGKASLIYCQGESWTGRLFEVDISERHALDRKEGKGYGYDRVDDFGVHSLEENGRVIVTTYLADHRIPDLLPYDWYMALVVAGHLEADLPSQQLKWLLNSRHDVHLEEEHQGRQEALSALSASGFASLEDAFRKGQAASA